LAISGGDTARLNRSLSASALPENLWLISPGLQVKRQSGSTAGPLKETGVWELFEWDANGNPTAETLRATGKLVDRYAVNLASSSETDLRNANESDRAPMQTSIASWFSYPPWYYLAILIGSLLVLEWGMYQRRVLA
jgi:hypothetical protein